ncbi:anti-sigma factor domain-containing protein [Ruminococcus sp.]|uniref:anti-sigma factor domain-containing protein n=1 Tax=Ruminococcus sp. TaxID=41978 RepID=UPI003890D268
MKVVIVDLKGRYAAALAENGEVKRIVNNHYEIGQEIKLYDIKEVKQPRFAPRVIRRVVAVAAAVIVLTVGSMATAYAIPYGTVSLESDPSIEYTINCFDYVIGVKALNDDGDAVLNEIDESKLRHHRIEDAIDTTVRQMEKDGYSDAENGSVAINVNTPDNDRSDRMKNDLNHQFNSNAEKPTETAENQQAKEQMPNNDQNDRQQEQPNGNSQQNETPRGQNNDQPQAENNSPQQDNPSDRNQSGEPSPNRNDQGDTLMR